MLRMVNAHVAERMISAPARRKAIWAAIIVSGSSSMGFEDQRHVEMSLRKASSRVVPKPPSRIRTGFLLVLLETPTMMMIVGYYQPAKVDAEHLLPVFGD